MSNSLWPHGLQHARLPCPSWTLRACSNSCPSRQGCHPTISFSLVPFSSCLQSFPASESFPRSQFFTSSGHSIGVSALASVFSTNFQGWFSLELTGLISLQCKGLSRVFSNSTVQCSGSVMSNSLLPRGLQHTRPPYPSPTLRACSNSCPSSRWCHPTISSSVVPFYPCL